MENKYKQNVIGILISLGITILLVILSMLVLQNHVISMFIKRLYSVTIIVACIYTSGRLNLFNDNINVSISDRVKEYLYATEITYLAIYVVLSLTYR